MQKYIDYYTQDACGGVSELHTYSFSRHKESECLESAAYGDPRDKVRVVQVAPRDRYEFL